LCRCPNVTPNVCQRVENKRHAINDFYQYAASSVSVLGDHLCSLAEAMSFFLGPHPHVKPVEGADVIKEVRAYIISSKEAEEKGGGGADCHSQAHGHWIVDTPISNPR